MIKIFLSVIKPSGNHFWGAEISKVNHF